MPISISSPSRNLFLLGSVGGEVITNFFRTVDKYDTAVNPNPQDYTYGPTEIRYNFSDQKFLLAGTKISGHTDKYEGWIEKRTGANAVSGLDNQLDTEIGIGGTNGDDVELLCMELDNSNNILAAGKVGDVPFVARYTNAGGLQWQSTTNSANVIYTGLAVDSNDNIYAAGSLLAYNGNTHAFIEKFDSNGNPGWGKSAYFLGNICGVRKIAANSRGEVVAVGTLNDDDHTRGYIVKLDTATGDVKWDKTLESSEGMPSTTGLRSINCEDVFIDTNDQIYVVGRGRGFTSNIGFIVKMTAEGNIIWQKQTPIDHDIAFWNVKSDGETEQTIVLGDYRDTSGKQYGLLSKYAKNGDLVWRRVIYSSYNNGDYYGNRIPSRYGGGVNLDADPSFYYLLASDEEWSTGNSTPKSFHFGKVSTSGNGLGNFEYDEGSGETIFYEIEPIEDEIGRLDDNSVRNDSSDFITYPFSPTKILFDDLATRVDNKKRHSDSLGFEYSGSPAIRPADFQELNLLGDTSVDVTTGPTYSNDWAAGINNPAFSFNGDLNNFSGSNGGNFGPFVYSFSTPITGVTTARLYVNLGASAAQVSGTTDVIVVDGTDVTQKAKDANAYADVGFQWIDVTTEVAGTWNTLSIQGTSGSTNPSIAAVEVNGTILIDDFSTAKLLDQSGKGNNSTINITEKLEEPHPGFGSVKFDGVDDYLSIPDTQLLEILDEDFTVEFWIYVTGDRAQQCIFSKGRNVQCYWNDDNTIALYLDSDNNSSTGTNGYGVFFNSSLTGVNSVMKNQWYHVAICRDNNTWKAFVDGVQKYSNVIPGLDPVWNSSEDFEIGSYVNNRGQGSLANEFEGYISNFRWVKGEALYLSNFAVPSTPLTPAGGSPTGVLTSLLTCQGDTIVDAKLYTANVITANGGVAPSQLRLSPSVNADGYLDFNGVDSNIVVSRDDFNSSGKIDFSIESWFYFDSLPTLSTSKGYIWDQSPGASGVAFRASTAGDLTTFAYPTGGGAVVLTDSGVAIQTGRWYHAVSVFETDKITLYVDGEFANSAATMQFGFTSVADVGNTDFFIGCSTPPGSEFMDGRIGEVRIYDRVLTAPQVFQNYNSTKSKYIAEAPDTAPKIGPGIVYDSNLLLNYDFGNRACYDKANNKYDNSTNYGSSNWALQNANGITLNTTDVRSPVGDYTATKWLPTGTTTQYIYDEVGSLGTAEHTMSVYVRTADGETNTFTMNLFSPTQQPGTSAFTATDEWQRFDWTFTPQSQSLAYPVIVENLDKPLYIWGPQIEKGSGLSRYVPTYTSSISQPTTVKNISSNSSPDTINGATFNSAGYFEFASGDYISPNINDVYSGSGDFTVEQWVNLSSIATNTNNSFSSEGLTVNGHYGLRYSTTPTGDPFAWGFGTRDGTSNRLALMFVSEHPTLNTWYHIVGTRSNAGTMLIYVNGVVGAGTDTSTNTVTNADPKIGVATGGGSWNGGIAETRIYNRALGEAEVVQNFNATRGKYGV